MTNRPILHNVFRCIKARCSNPNNSNYKWYGARGITCEWSNCADFERDMLASYLQFKKLHNDTKIDIDRVDNSLNYSKENCRWTTHKDNCNNRRDNRTYTYNGKTLTKAGWSDVTGIGYFVLRERLERLGWDTARALTTPVRIR